MAKLYFRYGAMGSSKTANAIMVQYNYQERGQRALLMKPRLDNRDGVDRVGSRSGLSARCRFVEDMDGMDLSQYNCIIVDEAQFLTKTQVEKLVSVVDDQNIPVICYGLRADFQGNLFEGSQWLLAWADTIEEVKTVCWCGRKATCNTRVVGGRVTKEGQQILLGGSESYVALCRRHWRRGELAPLEIRKISAGKWEFRDLLLEADPEEAAVNRYLDDSDLYVLFASGSPVSEICLWQRPDGHLEIKNLATRADQRGKGYARKLIDEAVRRYSADFRRLYVGTALDNIAFYESCGFRRDYVEKDFFLTHYAQPIYVDGQVLRDMQYLVMDLDI